MAGASGAQCILVEFVVALVSSISDVYVVGRGGGPRPQCSPLGTRPQWPQPVLVLTPASAWLLGPHTFSPVTPPPLPRDCSLWKRIRASSPASTHPSYSDGHAFPCSPRSPTCPTCPTSAPSRLRSTATRTSTPACPLLPPVAVLSQSVATCPLRRQAPDRASILHTFLSCTLHVRSVRKSCGPCLQNMSRIRSLLTSSIAATGLSCHQCLSLG